MSPQTHWNNGAMLPKEIYNNQHNAAFKGSNIGAFTGIPLKASRKCRRRSHRSSRRKRNVRRYSGHTRGRRQLELATSAVEQLVHLGVAGTIDIMSPTVDNPVGEKIASLSVSTEASSDNQFDLTPPDSSPTTFYLTLANLTLEDGNIPIHIEVPVYVKESASYVIHCATFDTSSASPLTARECIRKEEDANAEDGQLFSYTPSTGAIRPR
ncbi:1215_t:CDS:2, partial [Acaulospora colombiana]